MGMPTLTTGSRFVMLRCGYGMCCRDGQSIRQCPHAADADAVADAMIVTCHDDSLSSMLSPGFSTARQRQTQQAGTIRQWRK
jgi:hypothetical protein